MSKDDEQHGYSGGPLINPRTGELQDYIAQRGTAPPEASTLGITADRWGRRFLMVTNQLGQSSVAAKTFVDIRTLNKTKSILLEARYALPDSTGRPVLPFRKVWPFGLTGEQMTLIVRRSVDNLSDVTTDTYVVNSFGIGPASTIPSTVVLPVDVIETQKLGVDVSFTNILTPAAVGALWIEVIATEVHEPAERAKIKGYGEIENGASTFFASTVVAFIAIGQRADRRQFFIQNTSTTGDLYVGFGFPPSVGPPPAATFILPANQLAVYEAPIDGFTGDIYLVWNVAGSGGALVTAGVYDSKLGTVNR